MKIIRKLFGNKMHLRKFKDSNYGVVGIVVAVLLVGLLVTFMSIIQVYYVPKWMKEKESEHMNVVSNQFSQFKFAIDTQTALEDEGIPMTSPFTLGSSELPFFMSMPAYGQLNIIDDTCNVTFYFYNGTQEEHSLGIIVFSSINAYLGDQSFIYENGAIINSQSEGNIVSVKPFFKPDPIDDYNLTFRLIDIESIGGKTTSQTSTDATSIQTEYSSNSYNKSIKNVTEIRISSNYLNSWYLFLNSTLKNVAWADPVEYSDHVRVNFNDNTTIDLEKYEIWAQIGPGWIEK